ncbi:MAG: Rpn family recombination-promoting nuclease/putative transposase [Solobacterium sp.]|nr:Rpn family recombination-promoting nuclease/putative transposase [Solobacterium sp.]
MDHIKRINISHPLMFQRVMAENPSIARRVLSLILRREVEDLLCIMPENAVGLRPDDDYKSVRFDVAFKGDKERYVIELQNQKEKCLPQRMRMYQAMQTTESCITKGEGYDKLKPSIIIWITNYDPFEAGLGIYTFFTMCKEKLDLKFGEKPFFDGGLTVVLNLKGDFRAHPKELRDFVEYMNGEAEPRSELTTEIDERVEKYNQDSAWCRRAMELENFLVNYAANKEYAAKMEGIEKGREEGREETVRKLVFRMLDEHAPDDMILRFTDLKREELDKLRREAGRQATL